MSKKRSQVMIALGCVVKDDAVLLARRNEPAIPKIHGKWELPGGKVEFGEDPARTCEREIFEETGVTANAGEMLPFPFVAIRRFEDHDLHAAIVCFVCDFIETTLIKPESKISEVRWLKFDEIDPVWVQTGSLRFLQHVLKQKGVEPHQKPLRTHYISLYSFDASRNRDREYSLVIDHEIASEQVFTVHCAWGRAQGWKQGEQQVFSDRDEMLSFVDRKLKLRLNHGYRINDVSDNFPDVSGFHRLASRGEEGPRSASEQLELFHEILGRTTV